MSNFGNMAAPFVVTFAQLLTVKAAVAGGCLNVLGGLCMFLVKETKIDIMEEEKENLSKEIRDDELP